MNKSTLEMILNKAIIDYQHAPYYINTGKPKFLKIQTEIDMWFIDPKAIIYQEDIIGLKLYKNRNFEIANITGIVLHLPYTSILSVLQVSYDDNNDFGLYESITIRVSNETLPILMPY